jgi:hypothetical protein
MDEATVQQIVDELLRSLEPLDARSAALMEFIKARGIASQEELAPFLEQAGNASNVRWRAMRVRTAALISHAMKAAESPAEGAAARNLQPAAEMEAEKEESQPVQGGKEAKRKAQKGKGQKKSEREAAPEEDVPRKMETGKNQVPEREADDTSGRSSQKTKEVDGEFHAKEESAKPPSADVAPNEVERNNAKDVESAPAASSRLRA